MTQRPRLRACVWRWPEAVEGLYDPRCCRFPKSCSCDIYDDDIDPSLLEEHMGVRARSCPTCHHVGTNELCSDAWHKGDIMDDFRARLRKEMAEDWTIDRETKRSNSSPIFKHLVSEVERIIRQDAVKLIAGRAEMTAGLIMAQLAHKHHVGPRPTLDDLKAAVEAADMPECGQWYVDELSIDCDAPAFWEVIAKALGNPSPSVLPAPISPQDMDRAIEAAQGYDLHWRELGQNWSEVPRDQVARLLEGALRYLSERQAAA